MRVPLNCRREVVAKWRKRFFEQRLAGLDDRDRPGRPRVFPPEVVVQVKALACELPSTHAVPLVRWSRAELARYVRETGLVGTISGSTIWRWLSKDAIRPWQHRSWLFPRDPRFAQKAAPVLDLYRRCWEGQPLRDDEFVISADEKTSIQARRRTHASVPARPRRAMRVEHEYQPGRSGGGHPARERDERACLTHGQRGTGAVEGAPLRGQVPCAEPYGPLDRRRDRCRYAGRYKG